MFIIGIDTGGTFTDFVYKDRDRWGIYKVLSTPSNPATAVLKGLKHIAGDRPGQIVHGSTVATNAILERKGAKTALITNKGFEDIIEIGRQNRSRLYDLGFQKEPQLVPAELRFGVKGRVLHTGEETESLDTKAVQKINKTIMDLEIESVAVCLLFAYVNPSHEQKIGELLEKVSAPVFLSHEILAEFREFERTSTTIINAYVSPKMQGYIRSLRDDLEEGSGLSIMQSNGGRISPETAMKESARTILSGPAGGAVGAFETGGMAGRHKLITLDMGGTSTDVCLMNGALPLTTESEISGFPLKVPMIDIHTIGAGGGSIAFLDAGRSLRVGPESAGADPGPICYGNGEQITVTDANLFLGRLIPDHFLGGAIKLKTERLETYFDELASAAGISKQELAEGILTIVNAEMEKAVRVISVEKGHDPREFTLFSFGGAGGMHAAFLAKLLNIPKVLVPKNPGILSASGMLMADVIKDYSHTVMKNQFSTGPEDLQNLFALLEQKGTTDILAEGISENNIMFDRFLDMRYEGQSYEIMVPFNGDHIMNFHRFHEKVYGYKSKDNTVEIVNIRLRAKGVQEKPEYEKTGRTSSQPLKEAFIGEREVVFDLKAEKTQIIDRQRLMNGNRINGPAIVTEYSSTIVIPPFANAYVDEFDNMILEIN